MSLSPFHNPILEGGTHMSEDSGCPSATQGREHVTQAAAGGRNAGVGGCGECGFSADKALTGRGRPGGPRQERTTKSPTD